MTTLSKVPQTASPARSRDPCEPGRFWPLLLLAALTAGCVPSPTIRPLTEVPRQVPGLSDEAVVLFRLTARIGKETVAAPYRLEIAELEARQLEPVPVFAPSSESRAEGWGYFRVEPAKYRLAVVLLFFGYPSTQFELTVDPGQPIVYAGSLSTSCRRESTLLFTLTTDCSAVAVSDETGAAKTLAESPLMVSTRLFRPLSQP